MRAFCECHGLAEQRFYAWRRELEHALALPAGAPAPQIILEAAQSRPIDQQLWLRVLTLSPGGAQAFVTSMNELETARDEFFHPRQPG